MEHGAWSMGHRAWGMGHGAWGMGLGAWGIESGTGRRPSIIVGQEIISCRIGITVCCMKLQ